MVIKIRDLNDGELAFAAIGIISAEIIAFRERQSAAEETAAALTKNDDDTAEGFDSEQSDQAPERKTYEEFRDDFQRSISPGRRVLVTLFFVSCLLLAYTLFCIASFMASGRSKVFGEPLEMTTHLLLFALAVLFYFWKIAVVARYKAAVHLDNYVCRRPTAHAVQWVVCVILFYAVVKIMVDVGEPFGKYEYCDVVPSMCPLHDAYDQSSFARMAYWSLVIILACGAVAIGCTIRLVKLTSGVLCLRAFYGVIRPHMIKFLLKPAKHYILQPLSSRVLPMFRQFFNRISQIGANHLSTRIHNYVYQPILSRFPGPRSRKQHLFHESKHIFPVFFSIASTALILITTLIICNIAPDDSLFVAQKESIDFPAHLVSFYSMTAWLMWRFASTMNYAPAVELEQALYKSWVAWFVQFIVGFPWLYTLWKFYYFVWGMCKWEEGIFGRAYHRLATFGSFSVMGNEINIMELVFDTPVGTSLMIAAMYIAVYIVTVQITCISTCLRKAAGRKKNEAVRTPIERKQSPSKKADRKMV